MEQLWGPPTLAVVLSEFGRDAALRFCATLADHERQRISDRVQGRFFDEYRRLTLAVVGDLPYVKGPVLESFRTHRTPLDEHVLVGFPGGVPLEAVVPRLGLLALEAMRGPLSRGVDHVQVLLPCNTLAWASWSLARSFQSAEGLMTMLGHALPDHPALRDELRRDVAPLLAHASLQFPTVPEAVIQFAGQVGAEALMPLGTIGICDTYRRAIERRSSRLQLIPPDDEGQQVVLQAIQSAIEGKTEARHTARSALEGMVARAQREHGDGLIVVEACTDLDYRVGLHSSTAYAAAVVDAIYGMPG